MQLDVGGDRLIDAPTEADLREAIESLDASSGNAFLVLGPTEMTYIQCSGDAAAGFDLEYQDGSIDRHYRAAKGDFDAETIFEKLRAYAAGQSTWKEGVEWERITW